MTDFKQFFECSAMGSMPKLLYEWYRFFDSYIHWSLNGISNTE